MGVQGSALPSVCRAPGRGQCVRADEVCVREVQSPLRAAKAERVCRCCLFTQLGESTLARYVVVLPVVRVQRRQAFSIIRAMR